LLELVAGCWLLVAGCWLLVAGCWLLVLVLMLVLVLVLVLVAGRFRAACQHRLTSPASQGLCAPLGYLNKQLGEWVRGVDRSPAPRHRPANGRWITGGRADMLLVHHAHAS
jgi:hypothetical protein